MGTIEIHSFLAELEPVGVSAEDEAGEVERGGIMIQLCLNIGK